MDLDFDTVVSIISSSTTSYVSEFSPVFLLIGGILLAFGVMAMLVSMLTGRDYSSVAPDFDFEKAEELERFYRKTGKNTAEWDYENIQKTRL